MSTDDDDFEARLRGRLHDLADHEDDWDDPAPAAREYAAAGIAPDDDPAILPPPSAPAPRRSPWTVLAVAAVLLAFVVAGGFGIRELARTGSSGSAASAAMDRAEPEAASAAVTPTAGDAASSAAPASGGSGSGSGVAGSCPVGAPTCADLAGCEIAGAATSTGPLADIASIRPSGITASRATSGATVTVPYQLTFATSGGSAHIRAASAVWADAGDLCRTSGVARPDSVQVVPVAPGAGISGSATFTAVDSDGRPLPSGEYQAVVVIPYSVDGSALAQLVSAPVTVVVVSA